MSFDFESFKSQLNGDGNVWAGDTLDPDYGLSEFWWEASEGDKLDVLGFGTWEVVEECVGKSGEYDGNSWENYLILSDGENFVRLNGEYNSWDAQGFDGRIDLVKREEKTIYVWSKV